MNKFKLIFFILLFVNSFLPQMIYGQNKENSIFNPIFALGFSTEKICLADFLIEHNNYYGGLSLGYRDREPGECDEETECYDRCNDLDPVDIIRYTHNRYSTFALMLKGGIKYSDYIFLFAVGPNFKQYYKFYNTELIFSHGCYSKGKNVTYFSYSVGIYHDYVVSPVILGITYSNIYDLGLMIGIKL